MQSKKQAQTFKSFVKIKINKECEYFLLTQ